jgi:NADH-quinone oxidoreductase subunit N
MTAPAIWIIFPLLMASGLLLIRGRQLLKFYLGAFVSLFLAFLALVVPIGEVISVGNLTIQINPSLIVLGRQFILDQRDNTILVLTYGIGFFWFFGGLVSRPRTSFVSIGLAMLAILVAAISVDPFLFSALLIEIAVLITIPLIASPGMPAGRGVQRYLVFLTLGMPFILLAGWALGGSGANLGDPNLIISAAFLLGLGFAFLLAVFPFYTWIPLMSEEVNPYVSGFVFTALPVMIIFILLDFLNGLAIIRESDLIFLALQFCGILMIATGGIWAAFQKNIARLFGYMVIIETGFFLFAIGMKSQLGLDYFAFMILPRMIEIGLIALGLSLVIKSLGNLDSQNLASLFRRMPFAAGAITAGLFSMVGIPLLAEFSLKFELLANYSARRPGTTVWIFIGILGSLVAIFRFLAVFIGNPGEHARIIEPRLGKVLILTGVVSLIFIGLFPRFFLQGMTQVLTAFPMLKW